MALNISEVLAFCSTADQAMLTQILDVVQTRIVPVSRTAGRRLKATATLSAIKVGELITFTYDQVVYLALVQKINTTSATVKITKITGLPRRRIVVGTIIRVSAGLLRRVTVGV